MNYKKILELYKQNKLSEEKRKEVDAEIEKQEAIGDYLFEREEEAMGEFEERQDPKEECEDRHALDDEAFTKMIRHSIRRAFMKMGSIILLVTVGIVLTVIFLLPRMVSGFYYNPGEWVSENENTNRLSLDMAVYTELMYPGNDRDRVQVTDEGYGKYNVNIQQTYTLGEQFSHIAGQINRGKLTLYDTNILVKPWGNTFAWYTVTNMEDKEVTLTELSKEGRLGVSAADGPESAAEEIASLKEDKNYIAYVSLDKMMPYQEFADYLKKNDMESMVWCAVKASDTQQSDLGFNCITGGYSLLDYDKEKYPHLRIEEERWGDQVYLDSEFMKNHFIDLLNYMADQQEFCKMMDEEVEMYRSAAKYIAENGMNIYGYVTVLDKEKLQKLNDSSEVYEIYIQKYR